MRRCRPFLLGRMPGALAFAENLTVVDAQQMSLMAFEVAPTRSPLTATPRSWCQLLASQRRGSSRFSIRVVKDAAHESLARDRGAALIATRVLSTQIRQFAAYVGLPLFARSGGKAYLPPAGQQMLQCARAPPLSRRRHAEPHQRFTCARQSREPSSRES